MSYLLRYRQAIEVLDRPLISEDGLPDREIVMGEQRLGVRLPRALREYYGIAGRLDHLNRAHNRLYAPHEWFVDAGELVFMEENQVVVYWGIPISDWLGDDPPVLQGVNVIDQPIDWHPEHGACSEFLLVMLHWQAVCGGMKFTGSADISPEALTLIRAIWSLVGEVSELWAFASDGKAACVIREGETRQLFVGARTQQDFSAISAELAGMDIKLVI
jgi:hypothetical protein